jgi:hypothetical protein
LKSTESVDSEEIFEVIDNAVLFKLVFSYVNDATAKFVMHFDIFSKTLNHNDDKRLLSL